MEVLTINNLKRAALAGRVEAAIHVQIDGVQQKATRDQKPYFEITVADAEARFTLRAWSDSPMFALCADLAPGAFLEISGEFTQNGSFGIDSKRWTCRPLDDAAREALLGGPVALREKQASDYAFIVDTLATLSDPRLAALCGTFLAEFGERFRRTAAARNYHHARRGGLVEHVAQMMRSADSLSKVYPGLNRDLLLTGVLLHDCGKLWENSLPEHGFTMPYDERGELLGHITIGIEVVNALWRKLDPTQWAALSPASEDVRLHLLHLIAAHHGDPQFGSPVVPKTPEAWALHYVDNLDAKMEMMFAGYETAPLLAPRVFERVRPLPGNLIAPLPPFQPPPIEDLPGDSEATRRRHRGKLARIARALGQAADALLIVIVILILTAQRIMFMSTIKIGTPPSSVDNPGLVSQKTRFAFPEKLRVPL